MELLKLLTRGCKHDRTIAKHDFFIREGQVANEMAVVFKGAFRMYFTYKEREQTGHFMFEGQWLGDYESFLTQKPAMNNVQALCGKVINFVLTIL